jgi:hypothetical protein
METLFLVLGLFLPRLTLILYYFFLGGLPVNTVPTILDIGLGIFLPRVLIIIYIVQNLGTDSPWFWIHLVVALIVYLFSGNKFKNRKK